MASESILSVIPHRRRCPECDQATSIEDITAYVDANAKRIRAFEKPLFPALLSTPVALLGWPFLFRAFSQAPTYLLAMLATSAIVWFISLIWFWRRYERHPDRLRFLVESHFASLSIAIVLPALGVSLFLLASGAVIFVAVPLMLGSIAFVIFGIRAYRGLRKRLPFYVDPRFSTRSTSNS